MLKTYRLLLRSFCESSDDVWALEQLRSKAPGIIQHGLKFQIRYCIICILVVTEFVYAIFCMDCQKKTK
jgi:hypothetical protein